MYDTVMAYNCAKAVITKVIGNSTNQMDLAKKSTTTATPTKATGKMTKSKET